MDVEIVRMPPAEAASMGREAYEARSQDGYTLWRVDLDLGEESPSSFQEEAIWREAGVVAIGAKSVVVILDISTGREMSRIAVPSYFGRLSVQPVNGEQWLFVLGWTDVHAYGPDLRERWVSRGVAADGITDGTVEGPVLLVNAEMDPPGGWFAVRLDVHTGREIGREPNFTDDYVGIYGPGKSRR